MRNRFVFVGVGAVLAAATGMAACSDTTGEPADPNGADAASPTDAARPDSPVVNPHADASDQDAAPPPLFTPADIATMKTLSPLPAVPADPTNAVADSAPAAAFGQMLFFDKSFSGPLTVGDDGTNGGLGAAGEAGKVACASCHSGTVLDDRRSKPGNVSLGTDFGTRRALALVNSSFYTWTNWGGRFDSQWSLPLAVIENAKITKGTRLQVVHAIYDKYKTEYEAIFGALDARLDPNDANAADFPATGKPKALPGDPPGDWENMAELDRTIANTIFANFGKAIAAYLRKLVSRDAPFDKFVAGDESAMSLSAQKGLKVFLGKGDCISCHSGPHFEDAKFHALGVPQTGPNVPATDFGRFADVPGLLGSPFNTNGAFSANVNTGKLTGLVQAEAQRGQFRTKGLRGVAVTGAYMHSGQIPTLAGVIEFYNAGGGDVGDGGTVKDPKIKPLLLSVDERKDLEELLKTLTGAPVPAALNDDTSK